MDTLNAILTRTAELVLLPLAHLPPLATLLICAAVAGIVAAVVFRYTSNQSGIARAADRMRAELLAMRLFEDDLRTTLGCLAGVFRGAAARIGLSLVPTLVLIVPFALALAQLGTRYE